MVNLDSENQFLLRAGTEIEVTSDEEGFRGAWYRATIIESSPKSASKKRNKIANVENKPLVQYKHLLAADGSSPLTELIDPANIRPLPPPPEGEKEDFELNDVVDANYQDGWWTGTVRKFLENGKLRVCFDNPPDVLDFDEKDLRLHLDWVNGNWVRPEKQPSTGSVFSPGTAVEVNLDNRENLRDVWFPAIIIKENGDGTSFVKYENKKNGNEAETVKVTLDSLHIRPVPPRYKDRNYELLEKVDTSYDFGWRAGVITKVLAGGRYNVFFKHGNEDREISHSELRPHVEWSNGKWDTKSKELLLASDNQEKLRHSLEGTDNPELAVKFESSGSAKDSSEDKTPSFTIVRSHQMEQSTPGHEDSPAYVVQPSKKKIKLINSNGSVTDSQPNKKLSEENASNAPSSITSQLQKMPSETTNEVNSGLASPKTERIGTRYLKKPVIVEQPSARTESPYLGKRIKTKQQRFGADYETMDVLKRKGRPTKLQVKMPSAPATVKGTNTKIASAEELNENDRKEKEAEMPVIIGLKANKGIKSIQAGNPSQTSDKEKEVLKIIRDQKKNLNDSGDNSMPKVVGSSQRRKRGRPRKLEPRNFKAAEDVKDLKGTGSAAAVEVPVKDYTSIDNELPPTFKRMEDIVSRDMAGERTAQVSEIDCTTKEVDMAISGVSNNTADEDQPLSTWIGGMHSSSVEELRLSSGQTPNGLNEDRERQIGVVMESSAIAFEGGSAPLENQKFPFVKKSPIWNTIESMEVFQIVPQNPHFHPLGQTKEEYREGTAIGMMVTFAGLFEKISMLRFNDSRRIFDSTLESLLDLEKHGFDVGVLRARANELLTVRNEQGHLLDELKDGEKKITELTNENTKLDIEVEDIRRKISELQETLERSKLKKEVQDVEIARLRSHVDALNERVKSAQHDFEKLAAAPWK